MKSPRKWIALSFAALVLVAGCGRNQQTSETATDTTALPPPVTTPEPTSSGEPAWVAELRQGEAALGQIVEQGRLGEVHGQAVKLQTLLKQVAAQGSNLTPEQKQQLDGHLAAADQVVDQLHDAGDAGDLTQTKAKFQEFQTHLRAVEGVFGVPTP